MLQTLRQNLKGWVAYFLIGLIIVVFGLFGAEALFMGGLTQDTVAEVNNRKISELDVRRAVEMRKQQLRSMLGENIDPRFLSDEFLLPSIRESVIQQAVLVTAAEKSGLRVGNETLDKIIVGDTTFHRDGKFDPDYYKSLLRQYAYTPASYRDELRTSRLLNQYQQAFSRTAFVTEKEVADLARLQFETRSFSYVILPLEKTLSAINVTDEEVVTYYEQHPVNFMSEAQAAVEYILLEKNALAATVEVSDEDVLAQYEAEIAEAQDKTERHAAHILIEEKEDRSHQAVLDEIKTKISAGEDFSALAKTYSADVGSAAQGGDVGVTAGDSFVPEFEEALKKLTVGGVSEPIKTQFGYHLIKLLDQKIAKAPTFEESRLRIAERLKKEILDEQYLEKLELMRDFASNAASLGAVASELSSGDYSVQSRQTTMFTKTNPGALFAAHPLLRNPQVVDAVFAENAQTGTVTEVLELNESNALVMRITEFQAAVVQPLEVVKAQVTEQLRRERAGEQLNIHANGLLQRLLAKEPLETIAASEQLSVKHLIKTDRNASTVSAEILKKAFVVQRPAQADLFAADTQLLNNGDWALIQVTDIQSPVLELLTAEQRSEISNQLQNSADNGEFSALLAMLTDDADIARRKQVVNEF
jgi:peptidyl-prolyl cis-trans isomerase D